MLTDKINTVVVGGGQAGIAMSEHLRNSSVPHVVFERGRIAERWRSQRWDSLVANGPAWHDRFPSLEFTDVRRDDFAPKEKIADYFVAYAKQIEAPLRCGVEVTAVKRIKGRREILVETSDGAVEACHVVIATGPFQNPVIPPIIPKAASLKQLHSSQYRNPQELAPGAVLVVGGGSSGVQIAEELQRAGRKVFLSVGPHDRPPRTYRGRDFSWWLGALGVWDTPAIESECEHVTIAVCGAYGGRTVDYRRLAHEGMTLVGLTDFYSDGVLHFRSDLVENLVQGDANYLSIIDGADAYAARYGLDLPDDPDARTIGSDPDCVINPILEISVAEAGIAAVIWATGFSRDYSWLQFDVLDTRGEPKHNRGISPEPGVHFLGLPWQTRRGSSFIWGVWHDAKFLADHITTQNGYLTRFT